MTLTEVLTAIAIVLFFLISLVPVVQPTIDTIQTSQENVRFTGAVNLFKTSFTNACEGEQTLDNWEKAMEHVEGITDIEVSVIDKKEQYQLVQAQCFVYGQEIFVLGIQE